MIARVSLELALRKEFDYAIPPGLLGQIEIGTRVQAPFGARKIFGTVTALAEESALRQSQAHPARRGRANAGHAKNSEARPLDWRLLLLCAGNRVEKRVAGSRPQERRGLEKTIVRSRAARDWRISKIAQTPAGSLEHHRRTPGNAAGRIA